MEGSSKRSIERAKKCQSFAIITTKLAE